MACVGALLDHLIRERAASDFDDEGIASVDIRDIEILALCALVYALCHPFRLNFICFRNEVMQINADALLWVRSAFFFFLLTSEVRIIRSLQVFENESHASVHSDKTKEGLSLFGSSAPAHIRHCYDAFLHRNLERHKDYSRSRSATYLAPTSIPLVVRH